MLKKIIFTMLSTLLILSIGVTSALGQCAMCRATLETNVSNGAETNLAASLNFGIMYLFAAPYLVIATVAFFWYKSSKKQHLKNIVLPSS